MTNNVNENEVDVIVIKTSKELKDPQKLSIDSINVEIKENNENLKTIFMGSLFTVVILILSVSYGITWAVLFIIYIDKDELPNQCKSLVAWDKILIIISFITAGLHIISSVIQLVSSAKGDNASNDSSNIVKYITTCRSCINYLAGIVLLLALNIEYFKLDDPSICKSLADLNLIYIIVEWCLVVFFFCFVVVLCVFAVISKKMKNQLE